MKNDATVLWGPSFMQTEAAKSARAWLVGLGVECLRTANRYEDRVTTLVEASELMATLAELPDEMVIRLRCFPDVFNLQA